MDGSATIDSYWSVRPLWILASFGIGIACSVWTFVRYVSVVSLLKHEASTF